MNPGSWSASTVYQNSGPQYNGYFVRNIQVALNLAGIATTVDGSYGPQTAANVKAFQATNGLTSDGIAGPMTYAVMDRLLASAAQLSYSWFACSAAVPVATATVPATCAAVSPAVTTSTLTPTSALLGKFLSVRVSGSKAGVNSTVFTAATAAVGSVPSLTTAATVSGTARVGSTLTTAPGTWTGTPAPSVATTWVRCSAQQSASVDSIPTGCATISGASGTTYVLSAADLGNYIALAETATNSIGSALRMSISSSVVVAAPTQTPSASPVFPSTTEPALTGTPKVAQALTATTGTWTPVSANQDFGPTFNGYYVRNIQVALKGSGIPVTVDGIYGTGTKAAVRTFQSKRSLAVDGIVGPQTWGAMTGVLASMNKFTFTWYSCTSAVSISTSTIPSTCSRIQGATSKTYRPVAGDVGKFVTVAVTGTKAGTVTKQLVTTTTAVAP